MRVMSNRFNEIAEQRLPALSAQVVTSQQVMERKMDGIQTQNDENHKTITDSQAQTEARMDSIEQKIEQQAERLNRCVHE
jgi:hypothetical protein